MNVIDVTVVGGPDIGARVSSADAAGGRRIDIEVYNADPTPAVVERVGVLIESGGSRRIARHGWSGHDPVEVGPPGRGPVSADDPAAQVPAAVARDGTTVSHGLAVTERGLVGWLGTGAHPGVVTVQRDGWLVTAWALLEGIILSPGERRALDPLWVASGPPPDLVDAYARLWAAHTPSARPASPARLVWLAGGAGGPSGPDPRPPGALREVSSLVVVAPAGRFSLAQPPPGWPDAGGVIDLSHPAVPDLVADLGARRRAQGVTHLVIDGVRAALGPGPRWGDASTPLVAGLRSVLSALGGGLGPDGVVHVGDAPLHALAGVADLVEVTSPLGSGAGPTGATEAAATAARRRALDGRVWRSASGPTSPGPWSVGSTGPSAPFAALLSSVSTVVLAGDPATWEGAALDALARWASEPPATGPSEPLA